jgi:hypothetical protein
MRLVHSHPATTPPSPHHHHTHPLQEKGPVSGRTQKPTFEGLLGISASHPNVVKSLLVASRPSSKQPARLVTRWQPEGHLWPASRNSNSSTLLR